MMDMDKENQEHQVLRSKSLVLDAGIHRTPLAAVNRRRIFVADPINPEKSDLTEEKQKAQDVVSSERKCAGSRRSCAAVLSGNNETPLKAKDAGLTYSLPPSPIIRRPEERMLDSLLPIVSSSCPEVVSAAAVTLPPVCEVEPDSLDSSHLSSPGSPNLPVVNSALEMSVDCEDGALSAYSRADSSCEHSYQIVAEDSAGFDYSSTECEDALENSDELASSDLSGSLPEEEEEDTTVEPFDHVYPDPNLCTETEVAASVVEELLSRVDDEVRKPHSESEDKSIPSSESSCSTALTQPAVAQLHTYMAEYTKFVECYSYEKDSPAAFPSGTSSLTNVTPFSPGYEGKGDRLSDSGRSEGQLVVLDSLSSFISDSDDSFSSDSPVQRQLSFDDAELSAATDSLDESTGFVRSSESMFDLREGAQSECRGEESESDSLSLSVLEQKVEFLALPPSHTLVKHAPKIAEAAVGSRTGWSTPSRKCPGISCVSTSSSPLSLSKDVHSAATSTFATQMPNVQTSTLAMESSTTSLSPIAVHGCEKSTTTEVVLMSEVSTCTSAVLLSSVALSPMAIGHHDQEINTEPATTVDADTMTQVSVSSVALSPMPAAVKREVDTMTLTPATSEVALGTETVECLDHSVLATAETEHKLTMTDHTGCRSVSTTMTPFKAMVKQGTRLTTNDIRKQHPRALANQLETLIVSNSRLEGELSSAEKERKRLQVALKEAKKSASSQQTMKIPTVEREKELQWEEERRRLEQASEEQQTRIDSLERDLSTLQAENEASAQELAGLREKCQGLEESRSHLSQQREEDAQAVMQRREMDSYQHKFERAQQMVMEREAELSEIRGLFSDLQVSARKQEMVHAAYQEIHNKILSLGAENQSLKDCLSKRASLSKEELEQQLVKTNRLQEHNATLFEELMSLKQTLTISNANLNELEQLYSVSSSDLLAATGKLMELNIELFGTRKAMQEATMSKETLATRTAELEAKLSAVQEGYTSLSTALERTHTELHHQSAENAELQKLNKKMKEVYEDKLENMALGVENLQRTLDSREVDIDNLEKDLYEGRGVILEQRCKMDALEADLREAQAVATKIQKDEEDVEFFKESNAYLEAERSVYVQSIRDLEEQVKVISQESSNHQQAAAEAERLVDQLQTENQKMQSSLSSLESLYFKTAQALSQTEVENEKAEIVSMAAANDLLQHMHFMLAGLKKKIGMQDVPDLQAANVQTLPPPAPSHSQSKPAGVKSRRHSRKSFVSKILDAVSSTSADSTLPASAVREENSGDDVETGSYLDGLSSKDQETKKVQRQHEEETYLSPSAGSNPHPDMERSVLSCTGKIRLASSILEEGGSSRTFSSSGRELNSSCPGALVPPFVDRSQLSAFAAVHRSPASSNGAPPHSLLHPPSSEPPCSGFAQIRAIPKVKRRSEQPVSSLAHRSAKACSPSGVGDRGEGAKERGFVACVASMKEVFSTIIRLAGILDRATQLSLQDLREENDMLRERTEILEDQVKRNSAYLTISRQETAAKDTAIAQLKQQSQEMTHHMMGMEDKTFEVKRLSEELKRLESELQKERAEKEVVSSELETLIQRVEGSATGSHSNGVQTHCMREIIALKKKNQMLHIKLHEQSDKYEQLGAKASRRMRVLEENWKKAEDEVYRLDDMVENIKQISEGQRSPNSSLRHILQLIGGDVKQSPRQ